jgi:hypothetical protein
MIVAPEQAQAIQVLILTALALIVGARAFNLSERWWRAALVLGSVCLGVALVATIVTWEG